jgi:hypothetical protein
MQILIIVNGYNKVIPVAIIKNFLVKWPEYRIIVKQDNSNLGI